MAMRSASLVRFVLLGVGSGLCLASAAAEAVSLLPSSQDRFVDASTSYLVQTDYCGDGFPLPCFDSASAHLSAPDFGPFDATVEPSCASLPCRPASATQSSIISSSGIVASGGASASAAFDSLTWGSIPSSESFLRVVFTVDQATPYHVTSSAELRTSGQPDFNNSRESVYWLLVSASGTIDGCQLGYPLTDVNQVCGSNLQSDGLLLPGTYQLFIEALAHPVPGENSGFFQVSTSFDVRFQLVPEPGTGLLLVSGLLGFALASRRSGPPAQLPAGGRTSVQ